MILIAEDDKLINQLFCVNLEIRGYQPMQAHSGTRALEIIRQQTPQLMLLDIKMPGLNGWELLRALDEHGIPQFPVIVVSASVYPSEQKMREFPRIKQFLFKPVEMQELMDAVAKELRK
jgi:DNA-binding response OmpR family regulator